jgi:hypothetical protein
MSAGAISLKDRDRLDLLLIQAEALAGILGCATTSDDAPSERDLNMTCYTLQGLVGEARRIVSGAQEVSS